MYLHKVAMAVVGVIGIGTGIGLAAGTSSATRPGVAANALHLVTPSSSQLHEMYGSTCNVKIVAKGAILSNCVPRFDLVPHGPVYSQVPRRAN